MGAPAPPGWRKKFRGDLHGKFVSAPPGRVGVNFRTFLLGGGGRFVGSEWFV